MDLKNMSAEELYDIVRKAKEEIDRRENERYKELVNNVVSAWSLLYKEFPYTALTVETDDGYEINVFDYFEDRLSANDFYR